MAKTSQLAAIMAFLLGAASAHAQLVPLSSSLAQAGYRQVSAEHGVTVFKHGSSRYLSYAAEGFFAAPPARLMASVLDYAQYTRLVPHLSKSRILRRGQGWLLVYQRLALPAINDRDYVLRVTWGTADGTSWLRYTVADQPGPPARPGVVRVQRHEGGWQFRPDPHGKGTLGRYELMIDLAGWVPQWLVRSGMANEMATVFRNLQQLTTTSRRDEQK